MKSLRESEQGCYFSIAAGSGDIRVIGMRGKHMPFHLPAITVDPVTRKGNGRSVGLTVRDPSVPVPIGVDCWVPSGMTFSELAAAAGNADWRKVYQRLRKARKVSADQLTQPLSREMREFQFESLQDPVPPMQLGAGRTSQMPTKGNSATHERTSPDGLTPMGDPDLIFECYEVYVDEFQYYYRCTIRTRVHYLGGIEVKSARAVPPSPSITTRTAAIGLIELGWCGFLGCSGGGTPAQSSGDPLDLQLSAYFENNDSTVGQMVHFSVHAPWIQAPEGTEIGWSWMSNDEEDQTLVDYSCSNNTLCSFRVYSEGRAEVTVQTPSSYGMAFRRIEFAVQPCTEPDPAPASRDGLRSEYRDGYTMPPCNLVLYQPTGSIVSWAQIKDRGPEPYSHAIYRQSLDNGLVALNQLTPVIITPEHHRIYSTPTYQRFLNPLFPNGRHIYGDAADMRALTLPAWDAIEALAMSLSPRPCIEEWKPANPHFHIDYRNQPGAIRQRPGPCPIGW